MAKSISRDRFRRRIFLDRPLLIIHISVPDDLSKRSFGGRILSDNRFENGNNIVVNCFRNKPNKLLCSDDPGTGSG